MQHPKRIETVHVETLEGELCIYDWQRMEVHNLNPTAATIWQLCDGQTTPQQMAGQLKGDLTPAQAEELVWLTLKRLEKANLLEAKVVKPAGRKVYTRREMLVRLGVTAALLPVISSIVAPGPVEAQSAVPGVTATPTPVPVTAIVLYDAGGTYNGDLATAGGFPGDGRRGADAICAASANRPAGAQYTNFRAFISINGSSDEIRDMPTNYNVPTNLPIVGQDGITQLASNWAGLLDGSIDVTLTAAGSGGTALEFWDGSGNAGDGSNSANQNCAGWTTNAGPTGSSGDNNKTNSYFIGTIANCNSLFSLKCIAY